MEKFHQKPEYSNEEAQRREEIQRLRQKLEEAMEHIEDEFSLQQISELTAALEALESFKHEFDMEQAKEEFFREYYPLAEEQRRRKQNRIGKGTRKRKLKPVLIAAAMLLCLNGVTMVIGGTNVFEALFNWNNETLQIGIKQHSENPAENLDKSKLRSSDGMTWQELEDSFGAEIPLIGYFIEKEMEITRMEKMRHDMANIIFSNSNKTYLYTIQKLNAAKENRILEKTEPAPTDLHIDNITYYFIENKNSITIIWQSENQVYTILGEFDPAQIKPIVQSIQYEEELH